MPSITARPAGFSPAPPAALPATWAAAKALSRAIVRHAENSLIDFIEPSFMGCK
jgi:hypothetical protein